MDPINATHDSKRISWVESANRTEADFPIQNLPFGVFRRRDSTEAWRGGVAIGDDILDLAGLRETGLVDGPAAEALTLAALPTLNQFMALGPKYWSALRASLSALLDADNPDLKTIRKMLPPLLTAQRDAALHMPADVGDYTDFYTSYHHAANGGRVNRRPHIVPPSFRYVPIGYHGKSATLVVSGTPVRRPLVQSCENGREEPEFGPTRMLDYEGELGFYVGPGNEMGQPIPVRKIQDHLFGASILNDWSARDAQRWESFVAGPLLGKNFATSLSPWVVTMEALAPFRTSAFTRPEGDPEPLTYLDSDFERNQGGIDIVIDVFIETALMRKRARPPHQLSRAHFRDQYFTIGQMATHHTSNGCRLQPGDVLGSGTISDEPPGTWGSMLENSYRGEKPLALSNEEQRSFLEDNDEIIMRAFCRREGFVGIGFGECRGRILASPALPEAT